MFTLSDEGILGTEPNTISLRREIKIRDYNDNAPIFIGRPYSTSVSEATVVGSVIDVSPNIMITDPDEGENSEVKLSCIPNEENYDDDVCETFDIATDRISDGNFTAIITLLKPLDYETRSSYILTLLAKDGSPVNPLSSVASVTINVVDIQDQKPVFLNAPYSVTVAENLPEDSYVLTVYAMDGDTGNPRSVLLTMEDEDKGYFKLEQTSKNGSATIYSTNIPIDREDPDISQNGGVYSFRIRATELINDEVPSDYSLTQVTVVVTDVDDHMPEFNEAQFEIDVPENLKNGTPLPGLSMFAIDMDLGKNSRYNLSLENVLNAENVFEVSPTSGQSRTPIVVKVVDSTKLDYDVKSTDEHVLKFDLVASVNGVKLSKSRVTVYLQDVNDNGPIFEKSNYEVFVNEDAEIGTKIADISATDKDSELFGKINYTLKGFGAENFRADKYTGGIFVKEHLDYEHQKSYSLSIVAVDGGGWESNANVFVNVVDVNDNAPSFEALEYTRTIREGATQFEPEFFVRANDIDGVEQGNGKVKYSIETENSITGRVFSIDAQTGEIKIERSVSSMDTISGQYEVAVSATDFGVPPMKNSTRVLIRVGLVKI